MPERAVRRERCRRARPDGAVLDYPEQVAQLDSHLNVVRGEQNRLARLVSQAQHQSQGADLGMEVEESRRLVEQDDRRLLGKSLGKHRLLSLSVAQRVDGALCQVPDAHHVDSLVHHPPVLLAQCAEEARVGRASHPHEILDVHIGHLDVLRQHHRDSPAAPRQREGGQAAPLQDDVPRQRWLEACHGAQYGALARAVGTQQTDHLPVLDTVADVRQYSLLAVAYREMPELNHSFVEQYL